MSGVPCSVGSRERVAEYGGNSTNHPLGFQETVYVVGLVHVHVNVPYIWGERGNVLGYKRRDLLAWSAPFSGESDNHVFAPGEDFWRIGYEGDELPAVNDGLGDDRHRLILCVYNINHLYQFFRCFLVIHLNRVSLV